MSKIKIKLFSFDNRSLDECVGQIIDTVVKGGGDYTGPIPMPTKTKRYVLNRSPHIDTKSKEIYYIHHHCRVLYVIAPDGSQAIRDLRSIEIKPGIGVEIKNV